MSLIKILFVDDGHNDCLSALLKEKAEGNAAQKDFSVVFEGSARSGAKRFKEEPFDIVITRAGIAEFSGMIKDLKSNDPDVCVIIFSENGYSSGNGFKEGIFEYLETPINVEKLEFLIRKGSQLHSLMSANRKLLQNLQEHNISLQKQNVLLTNRIEDSTKNLTRLYEDLRSTYMRTIKALAQAIDARDHYTHKHSQNVAKYAVAIAQDLHLYAKDIQIIREACELHDLGKIGVQDNILGKPAALSSEEWKEMRKHPITGAKILEPLTFLSGVIDLIRQHHENYDGSGYPEGLKGDGILLSASIIHLADAYDAMRSPRSYRKAPFKKKEALMEIKKNSGTQFDPRIVQSFLKIVDSLDKG